MSVVSVQQQMQELSLLGMSQVFETDLTIANKQDWSHEEFLSKLLQAEKSYRDDRFIEKKIKCAQFKRNAFLEEFDMTVKRGVTKAILQELMMSSFFLTGQLTQKFSVRISSDLPC